MAVLKGKLFGTLAIVLRVSADDTILAKHEVHLKKEHLDLVDELRGYDTRTRFIEKLIEEYSQGTRL